MSAHLKLQGGYYEIGKQLGVAKKQETATVIDTFKSSNFYKTLIQYLETEQGKDDLHNFKVTTDKYVPEIVQELHGLADGAELSYEDLFILNVSNEFRAILLKHPSHGQTNEPYYSKIYTGAGCTNLYLHTADNQVYLGHTEDINPDWTTLGLMLTATVYTENKEHVIEEWTQYVIPGVLPGATFGFNKHGLLNANNNIYQSSANKLGIPRAFMCRKLLSSRSIDDVKTTLITEPGISSAFSLHFIQIKKEDKSDLIDENCVLEVAGTEKGTLMAEFKPSGFYHHCNIFQHLSYDCHPEESSIHRASSISQYVNRHRVATLHDIKQILSDVNDDMFPVYRNGAEPDHLATASTGIFDVTGRQLYVYTGKAASTEPDHTFTLP